MNHFIRRQPIVTIICLLGVWAFLALLNFVLTTAGIHTGAALWFPISIFRGLAIHFSGIPYLVLFLIVLAWAIRSAAKLKAYQIWLAGLTLIIVGNLGQGSWDVAFRQPLHGSGNQYYHDAIRITSWTEWLGSFNASQPALTEHAKTHPPFAVLIHYACLRITGYNAFYVGIVFTVVSSLSIILIWSMFKVLEVPLAERNLLALLFSVLPSVNIYSAVSFDGLILTTSALFLLGLTILLTEKRVSLAGVSSFLIGLIITNLLTYGGIFLFAVAGIQAIKECVLRRKCVVVITGGTGIVLSMLSVYVLRSAFGYDHLAGFAVTAALENPDGFRGWSEPLVYICTRVESVSEIALFLSFGCLAALFCPARLGIAWSEWRSIEAGIVISGAAMLLAMFLSGAFKTGETARCALFIYPYIMLAFRKANARSLKDLIVLAGLQTVVMQLAGDYAW